MNELAFFAGAGGGLLGNHIAGIRTICAIERDAYAASVLAQRQTDGHLPLFPIWSDAATFDAQPWRGVVGMVSGGFPCQDISSAGRGGGITGSKSSAWNFMLAGVRTIGPEWVFVENSPVLTSRGLDTVLRDLASIGYDAEWDVFGAHHFGAPHERDRIWILAHSASDRFKRERSSLETETRESRSNETWKLERRFKGLCLDGNNKIVQKDLSDTMRNGSQRSREDRRAEGPAGLCSGEAGNQKQNIRTIQERPDWWTAEPELGRVANGVAHRMDRLKAIGNGQVPAVAAFAYQTLRSRFQ